MQSTKEIKGKATPAVPPLCKEQPGHSTTGLQPALPEHRRDKPAPSPALHPEAAPEGRARGLEQKAEGAEPRRDTRHGPSATGAVPIPRSHPPVPHPQGPQSELVLFFNLPTESSFSWPLPQSDKESTELKMSKEGFPASQVKQHFLASSTLSTFTNRKSLKTPPSSVLTQSLA